MVEEVSLAFRLRKAAGTSNNLLDEIKHILVIMNFFSVSNLLREYSEIKEETQNPKTSS